MRRHFATAWRRKTRPLLGLTFAECRFGRAAGDVYGGDLRGGSAVRVCGEEEPARGGAGFRIEPGDDRQDAPVFGAARLCADQGSRPFDELRSRSSDLSFRSSARSWRPIRRRRPNSGIQRSGFSKGCGSNTVFRRLYGRERLCPAGARQVARGLRAASPSAGARPGRFRRMHRRRRRGADQATRLLLRPAAIGRLFHQGLSGGDHGSLSRWARLGICVFWRRAALDFI